MAKVGPTPVPKTARAAAPSPKQATARKASSWTEIRPAREGGAETWERSPVSSARSSSQRSQST